VELDARLGKGISFRAPIPEEAIAPFKLYFFKTVAAFNYPNIPLLLFPSEAVV